MLKRDKPAEGKSLWGKPRHKYNAKRTEIDGLKFDSKLEASYYLDLKSRVEAGEVLFFHWQFPIRLPGGVRYEVDFLEFHADGSVHYVDVKGMETSEFKIKKRMVEALYPIEIEVVKKVPKRKAG